MKRRAIGALLLLAGAVFFFLGSVVAIATCPPEAQALNGIFLAASVCFLLGSLVNVGEAVHG